LLGFPVTVIFMGMTAYCVLHTRIAYDTWADKQAKIHVAASFIPSGA
jgi:hypothetical protein